jgi:DAK2 domain fusion protein YloV
MAIRYLDGSRLQGTVIAAANWVNARRDHLNAINVFPVPDGDTGTNMAATLIYAADGIAHLDRPTLAEVREALGRAVLVGARGNAGFILAQFTRGFLDSVGEDTRRIHPAELAHACRQAAHRAYEAIAEPVEGTILTVMREWSKAVTKRCEDLKDLRAIWDGALERARLALAQTKEQMALLKEHDVVDAGAQGFVHMLEGISNYLHSGEVHTGRPEAVALPAEGAVEAAEALGELTYRYCTQVLLENISIEALELRSSLEEMGDSLIVGGDCDLMKIHIHTDAPEALFEFLAGMGTVLESKAEDMQAQAAAVAAGKRYVSTRTEQQTVGLVIDSSCDLSLEVAAEHGITIVPCLIAFGDEVYRDKYELSFERFYDMLRTHPIHPTTSLPAPGDFHDAYEEALQTHDHVLSVHLSGNFSGTYQSAVTTAREIAPDRITVVDSDTVTVPIGIMGIQLARLARAGAGIDELVHRLEEMRTHSRLYCVLETIEFLVRGGRISKARGWVGQALGLLPVLTIHGGSMDAVHKVRSSEKGMEFIFARLAVEIPEGAPVIGGVAHAQNPEMAERASDRFRAHFKPQEILTMEIGPAVGAHAGPGAWGVYYLIGSTG